MTVDERFWAKVQKTETCWLWTATKCGGYGYITINGKGVRAHRWAYERVRGPIPPGLSLDHLCRVTQCVNPDHLEPVTSRENSLRGEGIPATLARKTHCSKGHEFNAENTRRYNDGRNRACRTCENRRDPSLRKRRRDAALAAGRCGNCSNPIGTLSRISCDPCALKHRVSTRRYEADNKEAINARRRI